MKAFGFLFGVLLAASLAFAGVYPVEPITYSALPADTWRVAIAEGDVACAAVSTGDLSYTAKLVEIKTGSGQLLGGMGDGLSGEYLFGKVLFDPIGRTGDNSTSLNGTQNQSTPAADYIPRVFYKVAGRDCYNWNTFSYASNAPTTNSVKLDIAGDNAAAQGRLFFSKDATLSGAQGNIVLAEDAGRFETTSNNPVYTAVPFIVDSSYQTIRFRYNDESTQQAYYRGLGASAYVSYEPTFVSQRGTKVLSVGTTDASMLVAKQIAKPSFAFSSVAPVLSLSFRASNHTFSTLITDTIDRTLANRQNALPEDIWPSQLSDPDTGGSITSPLRSVAPGEQVAKNLYRIGSREYMPFADFAISDPKAPGFTYVERQSFWVGSMPNGVAYDASTGVRDIDVNKYSAMSYSAKFEGNDYGIPVCTGALIRSDDWASCKEGLNRTDRHRVFVKGMDGMRWVISDIIAPTAQLASSTAAINGGQVKLAKEQNYGVLKVRQVLQSQPFDLRLNDVSSYVNGNGEHPAIIDILLQNGEMIGQVQVDPGTTDTFWGSGNKTIKMHVYSTVYSTNQTRKSAELAVYSEEITYVDGKRYDMVSSSDPDKDYKVSLLWKNRDYGSALVPSTQPDSLRELVVYRIDNFEKTMPGETTTFMSKRLFFQVKYEGITAQ
ncbi:MAG: hypothetical protein WC717_05175 [Candidatus Micrarchaeia archaeon]|jgi:hypothetical protein